MAIALPSGSDANNPRTAVLGSPELGASLRRFVRGKAPVSEVDDIVQATLADALAADHAPSEKKELERWVFGIARNKVVDYYRRNQREAPHEPALADEIAAESAPLSARELLSWAEKELPDAGSAKSTLEWMLREGAGEKLEEIASDEKVPAPRVRQRVARLRRHFRERWAAAVAAVAVIALMLIGTAIWWRRHTEPIAPNEIEREPRPGPTPDQRADEIRRVALEDCAKEQWRACLDGLNRARELDTQGDGAEVIQEARAAAERGLSPPPPAPEPSSKSGEPIEKQTAPPKGPPIQGKKAAPPKPPPIQGKTTAPLPVDSMSNIPVPSNKKTMITEIEQAPGKTEMKLQASTAVQQQVEMPPASKARKAGKPTAGSESQVIRCNCRRATQRVRASSARDSGPVVPNTRSHTMFDTPKRDP